jgi:carboxymethylenebutenolidase
MRLAVERSDLDAGVAFYGRHPSGGEAASVTAPLMIHHGELDERVNASWPEFRDGLDDAGRIYEHYVYDDANHGFHNDTTPRFDKAAADLAWERTIEFFGRHLNGQRQS